MGPPYSPKSQDTTSEGDEENPVPQNLQVCRRNFIYTASSTSASASPPESVPEGNKAVFCPPLSYPHVVHAWRDGPFYQFSLTALGTPGSVFHTELSTISNFSHEAVPTPTTPTGTPMDLQSHLHSPSAGPEGPADVKLGCSDGSNGCFQVETSSLPQPHL